jgi:putative transferase (TIGR04331 family)
MKRYLITTGIKETWRFDEPLVFLGEWCLSLEDKEQLKNTDYVVQDYHWNDRDAMYKDYLYLKKFHEKLIVHITKGLNSYHGSEHSIRYWRIVVGPWLIFFTQSVYDRWESINKVAESYSISETCQVKTINTVPYDFSDFHNMAAGDYWNHYIFTEVMNYIKLDCKVNKIELDQVCKAKINIGYSLSKLKLLAKNLIKRQMHFFDFLSRFNKFFFIGSYFSILNQVRLAIKLRQIPVYLVQSQSVDKKKYLNKHKHKRDIKFDIYPENDFEKFLEEILVKQIPLIYLEEYSNTLDRIKNISWTRSPEVVFTAGNTIFDDFFKIWVALKVEKGTKLIAGQHGGVYGSGKWESSEDHDILISDKYFSWGWDAKGVKPLPAQKMINFNSSLSYDKQGGLLHVLGAFPRYSIRMFSVPMSSQMLGYVDDQLLFISLLDEFIRRKVVLRGLINGYGWNEVGRIKIRYPKLAECSAKKMLKSMKKARLFVGTTNTTGFLEALAANMPTIIFWNPDHWELREGAIDDYDNLKKVGILHDSPELAAEMVHKVWNDIDSWWYRDDTQKARTEFCFKFARMSPDWGDQWLDAIKNV